jgi:hypothetical protein
MNQTILTTGTKITRGTPDRNNKQHQSTINDLTRFITNGAEYSDTLQAIFRYFVVDKAGLYDYKLEVIDGDISMCGQYITDNENGLKARIENIPGISYFSLIEVKRSYIQELKDIDAFDYKKLA